jgi:hypothetical protein
MTTSAPSVKIDSDNFIRVNGQKSPFKLTQKGLEWLDKRTKQPVTLPLKQLTELVIKTS